MKNHLLLGLLVFLGIVVAINMMTRDYVSSLRDQKPAPPILHDVAQETTATSPAAERKPDDPSKFGIVVISPVEKPSSQEGWDQLMQKTMEDNHVLKTVEAKEAIQKMQMNPAQYQETMTRLDNEIQKVAEMRTKTPEDPLVQKRLQVLYQMKAMSKELEKNGIVNENAPDLQRFDQH
jgi:malonyl CoA-acyl carrier protein transacylase